jgi:hypothetical protein
VAGRRVRTKAALLQSKRLYSVEQRTLQEDNRDTYGVGFGRFYESDENWLSNTNTRTFTFNGMSKYRTLTMWDNQTKVINHWEREYEVPVYYLMYNPWHVPWTMTVPLLSPIATVTTCDVGCRVIAAQQVFGLAATRKARYTPSYRDLANRLPAPFASGEHVAGWRLEHFVVDLVLGCKAGVVVDGREQDLLRPMFFLRGGPIAAAISLTIDAPETADLAF